MAKTTTAQRQLKFKEKHKGEAAYKLQRKAINKRYKEKRYASELKSAADLRNSLDAIRKKKERSAKKQLKLAAKNISNQPNTISPNALGKLCKKTEQALPKSPRRKRAVISKIIQKLGLEAIVTPSTSTRPNRIDEDVIKKVVLFFENDEISGVDPGMKSASCATRNKNKVFCARRHLLFTITEAYNLFKERFPDCKLGRSKFADLRPKHIKPYRDIPHNVCVCRYHENFDNIREAISKLRDKYKSSTKEFIATYVCDAGNASCMSSQCPVCSTTILSLLDEDVESEDVIQYRQWKMVDKRFEQVIQEEDLPSAILNLKEQLPTLLMHHFNQQQSQHFFNETKDVSSPESVVLQIDFAENYTCNYQDEIQSAHWSNPQVSLFTAVLWYGEDNCDSYAVASDNISHDRYCVDHLLRLVLDDHKERNPLIKKLYVFSDGAASQFKQKYNFANTTFIKQDYNLDTLCWTFLATSHGKGAVDGIGAVVKRHMWNIVRSDGAIVRNAETFVATCATLKSKVLLATSDKIEKSKCELDKRWENVVRVKGTLKVHQFTAESLYHINIKFHATAPAEEATFIRLKSIDTQENEEEEYTEDMLDPIQTLELDVQDVMTPAVGQWVAVVYDDQWLPGTIIKVLPANKIEIKFMAVFGPNRFIWPEKDDIDIIDHSTILTPMKHSPDLVSYG